jgi:hypothetical protein
VKTLEGGGLGMLLFLQTWTRAHGIQFKVFDPPAGIRQSLECVSAAAAVEIAGMGEVLSLLGWGPSNCGKVPEGPHDASNIPSYFCDCARRIRFDGDLDFLYGIVAGVIRRAPRY